MATHCKRFRNQLLLRFPSSFQTLLNFVSGLRAGKGQEARADQDRPTVNPWVLGIPCSSSQQNGNKGLQEGTAEAHEKWGKRVNNRCLFRRSPLVLIDASLKTCLLFLSLQVKYILLMLSCKSCTGVLQCPQLLGLILALCRFLHSRPVFYLRL